MLLSELKQLYVLITRARHCVLFFESYREAAQPVLDFWRARDLVKTSTLTPMVGLNESLVNVLASRLSRSCTHKEVHDSKCALACNSAALLSTRVILPSSLL